ncbi:class D beta-lactamase [Ponticoccus alexandrii]|uniref:Beta-lactamase n=1 Tax=Ponticoccus alexandrii TaxID=1943633 RepID=A0ABX7FI64_9RHOB|nr:class D beta-lactamase [Ponticoccus alexandrii]QRF69353.1 class D beta-lactamase [Ponticoccus alexandrii]
MIGLSVLGASADEPVPHPDWAGAFDAAGVTGVFVVKDAGTGELHTSDPGRAATRFSPASTFKIANSLIAADAGVLGSTGQVFLYDGERRDFESWNKDFTLKEALAASVVPIYQEIARSVGPERMQAGLDRLGYGNRTIGTPDAFWLDGSLRISAVEQIAFLIGLHDRTLPFAPKAQEMVLEILPETALSCGTIRAKTGWGYQSETPQIGWWIGWAEVEGKVTYFALNIDVMSRDDLKARSAVTLDLLREHAAIPADCTLS